MTYIRVSGFQSTNGPFRQQAGELRVRYSRLKNFYHSSQKHVLSISRAFLVPARRTPSSFRCTFVPCGKVITMPRVLFTCAWNGQRLAEMTAFLSTGSKITYTAFHEAAQISNPMNITYQGQRENTDRGRFSPRASMKIPTKKKVCSV